MNYLTEDLAKMVVENLPELGELDKDVLYDYIPPKGDSIVAFIEYGSSSMAPFTSTNVRSVQCYVRAESNSKAMETAWQVFNLIKPEGLIKQIGTVKAIVSMHDTPFRLKTDDKGNTIYVFNMGITYNYE